MFNLNRILLAPSRVLVATMLLAAPLARAQDPAMLQRLDGVDAYMEKIIKDWNSPGVAIGVVMKDKLIFAKGYGYRDPFKKLPVTPETLFQIASNTKLFTAIAAGMLVEEGKLTWDQPIRQSVPTIRFYNEELNRTVTLRDMLAHRTGITRHDTIWYKSDDTRKQLFEKLRYLEPRVPPRQLFLYNNLMYVGVGQAMEIVSGKPWETLVQERILNPMGMRSTLFTVADMKKSPNVGVPFKESRDSTELMAIPYYEDTAAMAPCGALVSNIPDMSKWLIALMNKGQYAGKQVLPAQVLEATLEPAIALENSGLKQFGFSEYLNPNYGMGRNTAVYRGHLVTFHGGDLPGFHTQVSFMPQEQIGVLVFVLGNHAGVLYDAITCNLYDLLLGMDPVPWSARFLEMRTRNKKAGQESRAKAGADIVPGTQPSHPLPEYAGEFEHRAYGVVKVECNQGKLSFDFHHIRLPLSHAHYDRFDSPDDELLGKWSFNYRINPKGELDSLTTNLDGVDVTFTRRADPALSAPETLRPYAGVYRRPSGARVEIVLAGAGHLVFRSPGSPDLELIPTKPQAFRIRGNAELFIAFEMKEGKVVGIKQRDPAGDYFYPRGE